MHNRGELDTAGAIEADLKIKQAGFNATLILLYALVGAIENRHWIEVKRVLKLDLILALDAIKDSELVAE